MNLVIFQLLQHVAANFDWGSGVDLAMWQCMEFCVGSGVLGQKTRIQDFKITLNFKPTKHDTM